MNNCLIKTSATGLFAILSLTSCFTSKKIDTENLPKDFSERPLDENDQKYYLAVLDKLKTSIESEISREPCTNAADWEISPLGAKPCGGPEKYIAYPKSKANTLLPKIEEYTQKVSEYNQKFGITSDCMMPEEPKTIVCKDGIAEFMY